MVELKGSLSGIGLSPIVQLIGELHHSGTLHLTHQHGSESGQLTFADGRLVAAERGDVHGLQAIAACAADLADGEFTFVEGEGAPTADQTLDVSPAELKRILARVKNGELPDQTGERTNGVNTAERAETACPLLGFADDRTRHYARPTALHRCFAERSPSLITSAEQRELCLSGGFEACPRYQARETTQVNTPPTQVVTPPRAMPQPSPTPAPRMAPPSPRPPGPAPTATMPPGVAARVAAANQMRTAQRAASPNQSASPDVPASPLDIVLRRGPLFIAGSVILGVIVIGLLLLLVLSVFRRTASPVAVQPVVTNQPTIAVAGAVVTQQPAAGSVVARATPPAVLSTPTALVRPLVQPTPPRVATPTPFVAGQPTAAPASTSLIDVRFASGPAPNWVDNQPYASWSDGAYRLDAQDATRFVAVGVPVDQSLSDVILTATFRKTGGPPGGGYGLIVRDQGPPPRDGVNQEFNGYVMEAGDKGEFGIWRRDGDHFVDLVPWTQSAAVRSGGSPNDLSVRAIGDRLSFLINETVVATVQDSTFPTGGVGLFVGGDNNEVALDRFTVTLPQ